VFGKVTMGDYQAPRIAFGYITRYLNNPIPIRRFLDNAQKHGHRIDRVIIAYSHGVDSGAVDFLRSRVGVSLLHACGDESLRAKLQESGLEPDHAGHLLDVPEWSTSREVPYGTYRNHVLIEAILSGMDVLLFFDSDVQPRVLTAVAGEQCAWQEIDFVGQHMKTLSRSDVVATTSDYSGYYIIPPMQFMGLSDFLYGLGKGMALEYMEGCQSHQCLNVGPEKPGEPKPTNKPLGGNLGLSLNQIDKLAPFYSVMYDYRGSWVKGRGEDTLLGQALFKMECGIMDIDLRIFHDTYIDFPRPPDIHRTPIRDRFYRACLGWIGRNPFMTWFLDRSDSLDVSFRAEIEQQRIGLRVGGEQAAHALNDARFADLPQAFEVSYEALPRAIDRYHHLIEGWDTFVKILAERPDPSKFSGENRGDVQVSLHPNETEH
jgi:hypothetical protein